MPEPNPVEHAGWVWQLTPAGRGLFGDAGPDPASLVGTVAKQNLQRTISRAVVRGVPVFVKRCRPNTPRSWLRELVRRPKARLEFDNALALLARGVPTAEPLAWGRPAGWGPAESVLVTRELPGEPLAAELARHLTPAGRRSLARQLGGFYGTLVRLGVSHPDPHPGNIFVTGEMRFALLDVHAVTFGRRNLKGVIAELALLNRYFQMRAGRSERLRFWRAFAAALPAGHLVGDASQLDAVARLIETQTEDSNRRFWVARQKRHLGDNRDTHRVTGPAARGWAARDLPADLVAAWLADPDAPFRDPSAELLKDSRTSTVARIDTPAGPVAYKRFNPKSPLLPLKAVGRPTPAVRSWLAGMGLIDRDLPTARPLACFQRHRFGLPTVAYLVCAWVPDAVELPAAMPGLAPAARRELAVAVGRLARRMGQRGVRHRDLKAANVLVAGGRPVLVDLVGVSAAVTPQSGEAELARLLASLSGSPHLSASDCLRCLTAWVGPGPLPREERRYRWVRLGHFAARKLANRGRSQRL